MLRESHALSGVKPPPDRILAARVKCVRENPGVPGGLRYSSHLTQHSASHPNSRKRGANRGPRFRSVLGCHATRLRRSVFRAPYSLPKKKLVLTHTLKPCPFKSNADLFHEFPGRHTSAPRKMPAGPAIGESHFQRLPPDCGRRELSQSRLAHLL